MITFLLYILAFMILTVLIFIAGSRLIIYADAVSEKTKIAQIWIGMIAISIVTSLPELVSNLSAVLIVHEPDLALGNIIGSNNFNVTILFAIELVLVGQSVFKKIHKKYLKAVYLSILITVIILGELLIADMVSETTWGEITLYGDLSIGFISGISLIIFILYFLGFKFYLKDLDLGEDVPVEEKYLHLSNKKVIGAFIFYSLVIVILGIVMSLLADKISTFKFNAKGGTTILGHTFVGSLFLAFATSLPELVVSIQAIRKVNSVNLAVGNIFGSNLFNLLIICISDFFYFSKPIFHDVSKNNIISIITFLVLVGISITGILRGKKRRWKFSPEAVLIFIIYLIFLLILFKYRIFYTV